MTTEAADLGREELHEESQSREKRQEG